eukprot:TRINITY_DN656_c0_g1_i1.p1 TRINITY_DN656_c0_g1~~TRINITY_DN656_c0_g1_i1.p1  ORF type:complete len:731 (+),score=182.31 TRINITY_DN656_c0_g1_i1:23-2194(+)
MTDTIPLESSSEPIIAAPSPKVVMKGRFKKSRVSKEDGKPPVFLFQHPRKSRGVVYVNHLPHGFYEHQLNAFMSQFGAVTNIRVGRSSKTGKFKGYAFVEFLYPEVAEVVASTMNNYLMFKKILKCTVVPKSRISKRIFRKKVKEDNPPGSKRRSNVKKILNSIDVSDEVIDKRRAKQYGKLLKLQKKLEKAGIHASIQIPQTYLKSGKATNKKKEEVEDKKASVHVSTPRPLLPLVTQERNKSLKRKRLRDAVASPDSTTKQQSPEGSKTPKSLKRPAPQSVSPKKGRNNLKRPASTPENLHSKKARNDSSNKAVTPSTSQMEDSMEEATPKKPILEPVTPSGSSKKKNKTPKKDSVVSTSDYTPSSSIATPTSSKVVKASQSPLGGKAPSTPAAAGMTPTPGKKAKTPKVETPSSSLMVTTPKSGKKAKTTKPETPVVADSVLTPKSVKKANTPNPKIPAVAKSVMTPKSARKAEKPRPETPVVAQPVTTPKSGKKSKTLKPETSAVTTPASVKKSKALKVKTPAADQTVKTPKSGKKAKTPKPETPAVSQKIATPVSLKKSKVPKPETPAVATPVMTPKSGKKAPKPETPAVAQPAATLKSAKKNKVPKSPKTPKVEQISSGSNESPMEVDMPSTSSSMTTPQSDKKNKKNKKALKAATPTSVAQSPMGAGGNKGKSPKVKAPLTPVSSKKAAVHGTPNLKKGTPGSSKKSAKSPKSAFK